MMKSIGLDIGTTTICGVLLEAETGKVIKTETRKNNTAVQGVTHHFEKMQDGEQILSICNEIVDMFIESEKDISYIGVTGQMHGILYVNRDGAAITPLYSWQDGRGNCEYKEGMTYSEYGTKITGYKLAAGFGVTTHFYNQENHKIPKGAACFCTIPDFVAMRLAQKKAPAVHPSMGASMGLFNVEEGVFAEPAAKKLHMDISYFPRVEKKEVLLGKHKKGMNVSMALGDNQASFLGSVSEQSNTLLNIGTGSQISVFSEQYYKGTQIECRPYINNTFLMVGAPLCGGAAYAVLKDFYKKVLEMFGYDEPENIYQIMNNAGAKVYHKNNQMLVDTRFNGTRENPQVRGAISQLGSGNFTPEFLTLGIIRGICQELYSIYHYVPEYSRQALYITGSGNGIRNNPLLRQVAEEIFKRKLHISAFGEEASFGAALYALYCDGIFNTVEDMQRFIQIEGE